MKVIKIRSCSDCPYSYIDKDGYLVCDMLGQRLGYYDTMLEDCPLEGIK